eukprot:2788540-Lingulodinium_polyedra.AAC.1
MRSMSAFAQRDMFAAYSSSTQSSRRVVVRSTRACGSERRADWGLQFVRRGAFGRVSYWQAEMRGEARSVVVVESNGRDAGRWSICCCRVKQRFVTACQGISSAR